MKPIDWILMISFLVLIAIFHVGFLYAKNPLLVSKIWIVFLTFAILCFIVISFIIFSGFYLNRKWAKAYRKQNSYEINRFDQKLIDRFYFDAALEIRSLQYAWIRLRLLLAVIITPATIYSFVCLIYYANQAY
ncbi:hypothetical protein OF376_02040 [Ureaplasma miroungigenitalium]|uniref:DUF3899 domain-containing protein n=1 Tax=Ureaplasma miroungigenitalium TaxID=1042321 RepID=A0ABT3BMU6_9BACT|nr:hypothetical protein [Ureaplasma miroungigenitalium]MCV3728544.1 hypothetical protein [Ureaplasma miroungigenitalium]MCV3734449.1 hypothetical protein [Ureaplasma miroungigenitalium]